MKMRAFWSQVGFRNFFLKVFSVFQKWTFINVQNRKPIHFCTLKLLTEKYYQYNEYKNKSIINHITEILIKTTKKSI